VQPNLVEQMTLAALADAAVYAAGSSLVCQESARRVGALASRLPLTTGGVCLECHLGDRRPRTDLVVRVFRADRAGLLDTSVPELGAARRFGIAWAAEKSELEHIPYVDLEFDLDDEKRACFVGAMIEPRLHEGLPAILKGQKAALPSVPASCFEVAAQVLRAAEETPISEGVLEGVRRAYDALGDEAFIGHLGSLRSRVGKGDLVRLIASMPRESVRSYLADVSWNGSGSALERLADRVLGSIRRIDLDLNLSEVGLLPDSGFYRTFWDPPAQRGLLRETSERLVEDGLVTSAQAAAIDRFARHSAPPGAPPLTITIKVKLGGDGSVQAKVYLSYLRSQ
jgi:hypothetical protein